MNSVSVIIPTFNRAHCLPRALDSVLAQTFQAHEIIVVDDGSTDNTREILRDNYPQVLLLSQPNKGVSSARNTGIEAASGDWMALLDSDDEWLPQKLEHQMSALNDNREYLLAHTNERWIRNGRRVNPMKKHQKYGGRIFRHCLPLCVISPSSVIIHKRLFDEIGLFDESLPACEDYDLWLRICAVHPVLFLDEALVVKYGGHSDQLSQKYGEMDRFRIRSIAKLIDKVSLSGEDRERAITMLTEKIGIYLNGARKHNNMELVPEFERLAARYALQGPS